MSGTLLGLHFHRSLCFCSDLGVPHRSEFFDSPLPLPESSSLCSWDWAYHVSLFTCDRKSCYFFRCMLLRTYLRYLKKKSWFFIFLCLWDKRWWILNKTGKGICSDICIYTCLWQECNDKMWIFCTSCFLTFSTYIEIKTASSVLSDFLIN